MRHQALSCRLPISSKSTSTRSQPGQKATNTANWDQSVNGDISIEEPGQRMFSLMLETAAGKRSRSEMRGYGQQEFMPSQFKRNTDLSGRRFLPTDKILLLTQFSRASAAPMVRPTNVDDIKTEFSCNVDQPLLSMAARTELDSVLSNESKNIPNPISHKTRV